MIPDVMTGEQAIREVEAEAAVLAAVTLLSPKTRPAAVIAEASRHIRGADVREAYWRLRASYQLLQSSEGNLWRKP